MKNNIKKQMIKSFFKENWANIMSLALIILLCVLFWNLIKGASTEEVKEWSKKSIHNLTIMDVLIIAAIHAWISRSSK